MKNGPLCTRRFSQIQSIEQLPSHEEQKSRSFFCLALGYMAQNIVILYCVCVFEHEKLNNRTNKYFKLIADSKYFNQSELIKSCLHSSRSYSCSILVVSLFPAILSLLFVIHAHTNWMCSVCFHFQFTTILRCLFIRSLWYSTCSWCLFLSCNICVHMRVLTIRSHWTHLIWI